MSCKSFNGGKDYLGEVTPFERRSAGIELYQERVHILAQLQDSLLLELTKYDYRLSSDVELVYHTPRFAELSKWFVLQVVEAKSFRTTNLQATSSRCPFLGCCDSKDDYW